MILGKTAENRRTVVKTAFNQRRKTMRNSLKALIGKECDLLNDAVFNKRPEQLSVEEFIDLTNRIRMNKLSAPSV